MKVGDLVRDRVYNAVGVVVSVSRSLANVRWANDIKIVSYLHGTPVSHLEVISEKR